MDRESGADHRMSDWEGGAAMPDVRGPMHRHRRRLRAGTAMEPEAAGTVVLVSGDQDLQDEVARLAAAAGVELSVAENVSAALALGPEVVLLGSDHFRASGSRGRNSGGRQESTHGPAALGAAAFGAAASGKPEVIVVGLAGDPDIWDAAAGSFAARVAVLPAAAGWLAGYLGRRRAVSGGTVLGIVGGCGGAGASTLACWLSSVAADGGISVLLADGDPRGGGLEWALGATETEGIRWPDLAGLSGSLNPVQLAAGLPAVGGFSLLSRGGGEPAGDAVATAVMDAARSAFDLTIVDVGRWLGTASLLPYCDHLLVLVPGRPASILAARTLLPDLGNMPARAVVRGPLADGLDAWRVANAVGLPLAGYLPGLRSAGRSAESGRVLAVSARGRIGKASRRILFGTLNAGGPAGRAA